MPLLLLLPGQVQGRELLCCCVTGLFVAGTGRAPPHTLHSAAPHHAHTQSQQELQVLQKERMKLCMFALIHSSGPCPQGCPHDPFLLALCSPPQSPGVVLHSKVQQGRSTRRPSRYVCSARQEWGVRNPSLPSWKVSSEKHSHASPRLP